MEQDLIELGTLGCEPVEPSAEAMRTLDVGSDDDPTDGRDLKARKSDSSSADDEDDDAYNTGGDDADALGLAIHPSWREDQGGIVGSGAAIAAVVEVLVEIFNSCGGPDWHRSAGWRPAARGDPPPLRRMARSRSSSSTLPPSAQRMRVKVPKGSVGGQQILVQVDTSSSSSSSLPAGVGAGARLPKRSEQVSVTLPPGARPGQLVVVDIPSSAASLSPHGDNDAVFLGVELGGSRGGKQQQSNRLGRQKGRAALFLAENLPGWAGIDLIERGGAEEGEGGGGGGGGGNGGSAAAAAAAAAGLELDLSHNNLRFSLPLTTTTTRMPFTTAPPPLASPSPRPLAPLLASSLTKLVLTNNALSGSLSLELIGSLYNLEELSCGHNQLNGSLPRGLFRNLSRLKTLRLNHNKLKGRVPQLSRCSGLEVSLLFFLFNFLLFRFV
jgi:hypothetical protein